jgi:hypothetical protein
VGLYREKESRYPLSLQQCEVAKVNARSDGKRLHKQVSFDGKSVYTNNTSCPSQAPEAQHFRARGPIENTMQSVEDCRTRASGSPQAHCMYKAVDASSSRYTGQLTFSHSTLSGASC